MAEGNDLRGAPEELLPGAALGYRQLIERIPAVTHLSRLDPEASTVYISPQVESVTGYSAREWIADPSLWTRLLHPDDRTRMLAVNEAHIRTGRPVSEEYRLVARDSRVVWIHEESRAVAGGDGSLLGSQGILIDVTERKRAEEDLRRQREVRARLLEQLVGAQEAERARMARAIHDDAIQVLTAIELRIELLAGQEGDRAESDVLRRTTETVRTAIQRLRALVFELEPPSLEREGLVGTILLYLRQLEDVEGQDLPRWRIDNLLSEEPPSAIRSVAYRIAQEAISNVRKHARAESASIRFEESEEGVRVTVHDDGVGFDPSEPDPIPLGHRGLQSMRQRAEAAGGWVVVESAPGGGTTVRYWLPASPS